VHDCRKIDLVRVLMAQWHSPRACKRAQAAQVVISAATSSLDVRTRLVIDRQSEQHGLLKALPGAAEGPIEPSRHRAR
jgi:hypothetical protein